MKRVVRQQQCTVDVHADNCRDVSRQLSACTSKCLRSLPSLSAKSVCRQGYLRNHKRDLYQFLCMLPMSVARSSFGMLTIGRIAYRQEGGDRSAQRGRSVIYDCRLHFVRAVHSCHPLPVDRRCGLSSTCRTRTCLI